MKTKSNYLAVVLFFILSLTVMSCATKEGQQKEYSPAEIKKNYQNKGAEVTTVVFQHLSGKLKSALMTEGVSGAVEYCNLAVSPLVDSLAKAHKVEIKRTSHRLRNPNNRANAQEQAIIENYLTLMKGQHIIAPEVVVEGKAVHYYAPIVMMENCVKCHGIQGQDIVATDYDVIDRLYPTDEAVDFKIGELRGIWSLTFER